MRMSRQVMQDALDLIDESVAWQEAQDHENAIGYVVLVLDPYTDQTDVVGWFKTAPDAMAYAERREQRFNTPESCDGVPIRCVVKPLLSPDL